MTWRRPDPVTQGGRGVRMRALAGAGVLVLALVAGCASPSSVLGLTANVTPTVDRSPMTPEQAWSVVERALGQAAVADGLRTTDATNTAFTGLALRTAASRYAVDKAVAPAAGTSGTPLTAPPAPTRVVRTASQAFDRFLVALSTPDGETTPQLAVFSAPDVFTPYRVASRVQLLTGAELPPTDQSGAPVLPADAQPAHGALVATPVQALTEYARLLQTGKAQGVSFGQDSVVKSVRDNAALQARQVSKIATFSQTHALGTDAVYAVRTRDGGALVIGDLERVDTFTVKKGQGHLAPPVAYKALAGGITKITSKAVVRTAEVVALVIPPAGGGPVQVIGFSELPESVTAR